MAVVTTSISPGTSHDTAVDITGVSGSGPWTVTLDDASAAVVGDALWDEHATPRKYLITAVSGNDLTVRDSEGVGSAPDDSGTSIAYIKRYYTTITLWEADLDDTGLYANGDDAVGECYKDAAFDESVTIDGGGTVGLASVTLTVAESDRHDGTAGTGARIVRSTAKNPIVLSNGRATTIAEWLEVTSSVSGNANRSFIEIAGVESGQTYHIRNTICHSLLAGSQNYRAYHGIKVDGKAGSNRYVHNNIVYDINHASGGSPCGIKVGGSSFASAFNNTVFDVADADGTGGTGISVSVTSAQNNIAVDSGASDFSFSGDGTESHNLSSDATASGTGSLTNKSSADQFVSTVGGSEDLRLKLGAHAINAGTDLETTPAGVNIDITGRDRHAEGDVWDIGAHEYVAVAAAGFFARRYYDNLLAGGA